MKLGLAAAAILSAAIASGANAITPMPPTYTESYTFTTPYTLSNAITANTYVPYDDGSGGGGGFTQAYGSNGPGLVTLTDPFLKEDNIDQTYFVGTSALDTNSPNHLIIAVNDAFAANAVETSFETVFGADYSETDVIGALDALYNPGSDQDALDAATNTIFGFSNEFFADGAAFSADGGSFTLLSFSDGMIIGTGTTALMDTTAPAVPEPASWALMIAGFGLTGGALRARPARRMQAA